MCHCNPNIRTVRCRNCPDTTKEGNGKGVYKGKNVKLYMDGVLVSNIPKPNLNDREKITKIKEIIHGMLGNECGFYTITDPEDMYYKLDAVTDKLEEVIQLLMGLNTLNIKGEQIK